MSIHLVNMKNLQGKNWQVGNSHPSYSEGKEPTTGGGAAGAAVEAKEAAR